MKKFKLKPSHWLALSCFLLVLVVTLLAYSVYVPRLQVIENLQAQLDQAKLEQQMWKKYPVPKPIQPEEKAALAALVPTDFDQSRFIKAVQDDGAQSGAEITNLNFPNSAEADNSQNGAQNALTTVVQQASSAINQQSAGNNNSSGATANGNAKKQSVLTEQVGSLTVSGNYSQVRQFLQKFSQMGRLVTFNHWNLTTKDELTKTTVLVQTLTITPISGVALAVITKDPLLSNQTPIQSELTYNTLMEQIKTKALTAKTQQDKDMANLEIQQTFNRYMAGLLNQSQAPAITNQQYAGRYIPDANPNIQQVLGLAPNTLSNGSSAPTSLLGAPVTSISGGGVIETKVTLKINFTLYYVPIAHQVLPAPASINTYEPTERTDPVESR